MKNYRRALPPLDYLLFFEAAARHGNFTRAAEELNVSQAAVSKRVRVLEDWLGLPLVTRRGRNIALTRDGRLLAASADEALDYLSGCVRTLRRAGGGAPLSLAANVAVARFFLAPRINEYLLGRNAAPVTLTAADRDADLFALEVDAIVYHGADIPAGWDGTLLFAERWLPVAAPGLLAPGAGLAGTTLLDFDKLTPKWVDWEDFAARTGAVDLGTVQKVNLGSYGSTLDTALRGRGVALGCPDVLRIEIEAGRLVPVVGHELATGRGYFLIWRPGGPDPQTRALLRDMGILS